MFSMSSPRNHQIVGPPGSLCRAVADGVPPQRHRRIAPTHFEFPTVKKADRQRRESATEQVPWLTGRTGIFAAKGHREVLLLDAAPRLPPPLLRLLGLLDELREWVVRRRRCATGTGGCGGLCGGGGAIFLLYGCRLLSAFRGKLRRRRGCQLRCARARETCL